MKRLHTLCVALLALVLCNTPLFAEDFAVRGIYYNITSSTNKTVEVTYRGSDYSSYSNEYSGAITIPESVTYNGSTYSVTSIGEDAFEFCTSLTSVVIPNSVTSIGDEAFAYCDGLTSVEIPNSVTSIGSWAFSFCSSLTSVVIPNNVTSIGEAAFSECSSLTSVVIPNSVTSIGVHAFSYCSSLMSVEIPNSVTSIGDFAFSYCSSLTSVEIPNSVTSIGYAAFSGCSALTTATVGCSWITNPLYNFGANVTVNATLHSYENGICTVCGENSLKFEVNGIYYNITSPTNKTVEVTYRGSSYNSYSNEYSGAVTIPESVTYNGNTYSVTSIGNRAFYSCSGLTSVVIPNSVTSIASSTFEGCSSLTSIEIPNSVNVIYPSAFLGCSSLTSVVIPNSVTSIGNHAFGSCSSLTSVEIPNSVTSIGGWTFEGCSSLTSVEIPNSVTSIGNAAFDGCSSLTSVEIPNSVTSIGYGAFEGCSSLTSVVIPNSVTSIGERAFEYCSRLTTATVGCSWKKNPLYDFGSGVTVNATLHSYKNGICTICGDKEFPIITYIVDGVVYATIQQKAGETPKLPEPPTKEGYTFKGWKNLPEVMPDEDITVEAEFTINTYEITYVIDDAVFAKQSVTYSDKITPPTAPEKEGHTFSGWKNLPATMPAHDLEIHGTYSKLHYLLTFILDGKVLQQGYVEYGAGITTPSVPAKEGYTFAGWKDLPETMPAHDVKVYGTYAKQQYLLTFIADGEVVQQCYVEYGEKIVPPAAPEKEGHVFDGWKDVPETMPARDLEIQGSYTKQKYLLSFVIDGKIVQLNMVEYGTSITPPQVEEKEGHTFSGWKNLPETMPAYDVTVTGDYEVNTYTVRIYLNGALYQTMAVDYGTVLNIPVPTVPEDMEFKGWTTEIPATMPAHDLDIYGTYDYPTSIASLQTNQRVTIYTLNGLLICKDAQWQTVKDKLAPGWYIVNGKKIFVKTEQ